MPPKKITPHQFSKNLTYEKQIPDFLKALVQQHEKNTPTIHSKFATLDDDEGDDPVVVGKNVEEEKPQIVVLKEGDITAEEFDHWKKKQGLDSSEIDDEPKDAAPKFRKPTGSKAKSTYTKPSSSKRKVDISENSKSNIKERKKDKKDDVKMKNSKLLSFNDVDE